MHFYQEKTVLLVFLILNILIVQLEAMHVHASDRKLTEANSAKFFVREDGSSVMQKRGDLTDSKITTIQKFIKENYIDMYKTRKDFGGKEFYRK